MQPCFLIMQLTQLWNTPVTAVSIAAHDNAQRKRTGYVFYGTLVIKAIF